VQKMGKKKKKKYGKTDEINILIEKIKN